MAHRRSGPAAKASKRGKAGRPLYHKRGEKTRQDLRVKWEGFKPLLDADGKEIKRHYKLETLGSATEKALKENVPFLAKPIHGTMGPAELTSATFTLLLETNYKLFFRATINNARKKRGTFGFVAAKNDQEYSALCEKEHANLRTLHGLLPKQVLEVYRHGNVFLPDRHRRKGHGREVLTYLCRWPGGFHELCLTANQQFGAMLPNPQAFTRNHSELVRRRMVELVAGSFDGSTKSCMPVPDVTAGDLMVTKPGAGPPKIKLIGCRSLSRRMTPPKVVQMILEAKWTWRGKTVPMRPESPDLFLEGLNNALGKEEAQNWLAAYAKAVEYRSVPEHPYLDGETLRKWRGRG